MTQTAQEEADFQKPPRTTGEMATDGMVSYQIDLNNFMYMDKKFKDYRTSLDKLTD
jgi:hypothetical protein